MRLCFLLSAALLIASPSMAWDYRNAEFGFQATVPDTMPACSREPHEHNDGFGVFLDGKPGDCMEKSERRILGFFANHNAVPHPDAASALAVLCNGQGTASLEGNWAIGGQTATVCRTEPIEGWIDLFVVAASPRKIKFADDEEAVPDILYLGYVHTRPGRLDQDAETLRQLLNAATLFPPE